MSRADIAAELHAPARRHFARRKVYVFGLRDLYQVDLVEMIPYARVNKGHKYMLTAIDCYSKYAWALPLKNKTKDEIVRAMRIVIKDKGAPKNLQTDLGKEFYNREFAALMRKHKINHYSTHSELKASIVERLNRSLKELMWRRFTAQGSYKWLDMLPEILTEYNTRRHRTIGRAPVSVVDNSLTVYRNDKVLDERRQRFQVGDHVRVSKYKRVFDKGYLPSWSTEIFVVRKIRHYYPRTYYLDDMSGSEIKGAFYGEELKKTSYPDTYLVEKVLRRKGDRAYVKWLGFDKNSWIPIADITDK